MATTTLNIGGMVKRRRYEPASGRMDFPLMLCVKRIDNSRLRREVSVERRRECYSLFGLCLAIFVLLLSIAWQHFQCVRYGYEVEHLKESQSAMEEWNHQLRLEEASLADPERIDELARKDLGFVTPSARQIIYLGPGQGSSADDSEFARNLPPANLAPGPVSRAGAPQTAAGGQ